MAPTYYGLIETVLNFLMIEAPNASWSTKAMKNAKTILYSMDPPSRHEQKNHSMFNICWVTHTINSFMTSHYSLR